VPPGHAARTLDSLTPVDLTTCAVWELTLREKAVGPNEGQVRPRPELVRYDDSASGGVYAVRTYFDLACGDRLVGYATPISDPPGPEEHRLGYFAPAITTERGQVPFWHVVEKEPSSADWEGALVRLGRSVDEVFPVRWRTDVPRVDGRHYEGQIDAFHFLVYGGEGFQLVRCS
jgi:hypothetical protein